MQNIGGSLIRESRFHTGQDSTCGILHNTCKPCRSSLPDAIRRCSNSQQCHEYHSPNIQDHDSPCPHLEQNGSFGCEIKKLAECYLNSCVVGNMLSQTEQEV